MTASDSLVPRPTAVPWIGYGLAMTGAVLFASKGVLIKLAYAEGLDALTVLAWRMILSAPIFVAVGIVTVLRADRARLTAISGRDVLATTAVGALGYWFASYADFVGLETLSPQFERLILFNYPLFVVLFGVLLFRHPFRPASVAAFGVSYLGLAVVFLSDYRAEGSVIVVGALWVLGAAIAFALYQLLAKPLIARMGAPLFTSIAMTAASGAVFIQYLLEAPLSALAISADAFLISLWLAIGATVLPTYIMNAALSRISAQANATISTMSPVVTLILAVLILSEPVTVPDLLGTVMVIAGVGLFTWVDRRR